MARPQRPWFRFYVEALSDRKLRRLTPAQRWLWVAILGAARQSPLPGWLIISEREAMDAVDLADVAGMAVRDVQKALPLFDRAGLIEWDHDLGAWWVPKFNARQFESDDVTKRTRKHRSGNVPTEAKERSNNVPGTAVGTPPETETETETEERPNGRSSERSALDAPRADVQRLCDHLADRVQANGSKRPKIGKGWRDAARLMLDRDDRTEAQVHSAIDWCQDDEFWRANVLSMPTLREKYDQLRLQAQRSRASPNGAPSPGDQRIAALQALKAPHQPALPGGDP